MSSSVAAQTPRDDASDDEPTRPARRERQRLGDVLVAEGAISKQQLKTALREQNSVDGRRRRLGTVLRDLGFADDRDIAVALAAQLRLEVVTGAVLHAAPKAAVDLVPRRIASHHNLIPLDYDSDRGALVVAVDDPTNIVALDDLRSLPGVRSVSMRVGESGAIHRARSLLYERGVADATVEAMRADSVDEVDDLVDASGDLDDGDNEPVVRLVNALLADAIRSRASDVHVEPERTGMRVRYRVDGMLREAQQIPKHMSRAVTSRLKVMSQLDIAERRMPQDGRASIRVDGQEVDLRVSTMPSLHGETTVLRLLRKGAERLGIDDLGLDDAQRRVFANAIGRSQGLIVMTGPTGSGKTTTLYAGLSSLADPTRNVITLEDPIEYQLDGINQTQVNARIGMTFATGLRAVLRQDPDVVMVGEVRDAETAGLAVEASFTGHLVLSTLHTNDAPSTVVRLAELGVERFLLGTTLLLVVAQRLARRICDSCSVESDPDPEVLEQLDLLADDLADADLRHGTGCVECDGTGYRGRVGLYEILRMTPRMRQLIADRGTELQIAALARAEGMRSLRQDALAKALAGVTTLTEVLRITPDDAFRQEVTGQGGPGGATATAVRLGAISRHRVLVLGSEAADELEQLAPDGWSLDVTQTPDEAVKRMRASDPDLLLVEEGDDPWPVDELLDRVREVEHDDRPVVVWARRPLDDDRVQELLALGASDIVDQHVDGERLLGMLTAAMSRD